MVKELSDNMSSARESLQAGTLQNDARVSISQQNEWVCDDADWSVTENQAQDSFSGYTYQGPNYPPDYDDDDRNTSSLGSEYTVVKDYSLQNSWRYWRSNSLLPYMRSSSTYGLPRVKIQDPIHGRGAALLQGNLDNESVGAVGSQDSRVENNDTGNNSHKTPSLPETDPVVRELQAIASSSIDKLEKDGSYKLSVRKNKHSLYTLTLMLDDKVEVKTSDFFKRAGEVSKIKLRDSQRQPICKCVKDNNIRNYHIYENSVVSMTIQWNVDGKNYILKLQFDKGKPKIDAAASTEGITIDDVKKNTVVQIDSKPLSAVYEECKKQLPSTGLTQPRSESIESMFSGYHGTFV